MTCGKNKVLVVDDSALMRQLISDIIDAEPEFEVIAVARDGEDAVRKVLELKPDVVTLDMRMPKKNGLEVLEYIMSKCPIPVVIISAYVQQGSDLAIRALEVGAVDVIAKSSGEISADINILAKELIAKLKAAVLVNMNQVKAFSPKKVIKPKIIEPSNSRNEFQKLSSCRNTCLSSNF